ncbi:MAG: hypothetical protein IPJ25_08565 [Rhodocyclaceae bacterium]|nr:hypothetical protein [Rhodocyclaceae bacterium]
MTLSASAGSVTEGGTITYTASVNNPVTGSDPTVTLTRWRHHSPFRWERAVPTARQ